MMLTQTKKELMKCGAMIELIQKSIDELLEILPYKKEHGDIVAKMSDDLNILNKTLLDISLWLSKFLNTYNATSFNYKTKGVTNEKGENIGDYQLTVKKL